MGALAGGRRLIRPLLSLPGAGEGPDRWRGIRRSAHPTGGHGSLDEVTAGEQEARPGPHGGLFQVMVRLVITWLAAAGIVLLVAADTSVGPVVLALSHRHGIHAGDLLALAVCFASALLVTVAVVGRYRRTR